MSSRVVGNWRHLVVYLAMFFYLLSYYALREVHAKLSNGKGKVHRTFTSL